MTLTACLPRSGFVQQAVSLGRLEAVPFQQLQHFKAFLLVQRHWYVSAAGELCVKLSAVRSHIIVYTNVISSFTLLSYDFLQTKGGNHDVN